MSEQDTEESRLERRLKALMKTRDGRAWVWGHLSDCGVFESSYAATTHDTAYNEGRRNVGLKLLFELQSHVFQQYQLMEAEAREDNQIEEMKDESEDE